MNNVAQKFACKNPDCTAATTGTCLLGKPTPHECENYFAVVAATTEENESQKVDIPREGRTFHTGSELGTSDMLQVSSGSYAHVIGLIGAHNAGKTCFLLSLYLMASRQCMPKDYLFRRSLTLQGFEDRARKLREWKSGPLPEQLADHTILADDRRPAFLHLGLAKDGRRTDLFFPDLPGEWTTSLIDQAKTAARWEFLRRADGIIVVLDGIKLIGKDRFVDVMSAKHLFQRLKESLQIPVDIPLVILLSKADEIRMQEPPVLEEITQFALDLGFDPKVILCAAFSRNPGVTPNGMGVVDAVEHVIAEKPRRPYVNWEDLMPEWYARPLTPFRLFSSQG